MEISFIVVSPSVNLGPTGAVSAAAAAATARANAIAASGACQQAQLVVLVPNVDPGVTGIVFASANTLKVSPGVGNTAVQIGSTGPTGTTGSAVL